MTKLICWDNLLRGGNCTLPPSLKERVGKIEKTLAETSNKEVLERIKILEGQITDTIGALEAIRETIEVQVGENTTAIENKIRKIPKDRK